MRIEYEGKEIFVEIIGGFECNSKKYAVCSYIDEENQKIVIIQVINDEKGTHGVKIPPEEIAEVTECFNQIKQQLLEG